MPSPPVVSEQEETAVRAGTVQGLLQKTPLDAAVIQTVMLTLDRQGKEDFERDVGVQLNSNH